MFTVDRRTGRLIEARVFSMTGPEDVRAYANAFAPFIAQVPESGAGKGPILCADHRLVAIYPPPVADGLVSLFSSLNATWERVAIIAAPTNATLVMQLQRIVRESSNTSRRVFLEPREAASFLGDALSPSEFMRLRAFLDEAPQPPRSAPRR